MAHHQTELAMDLVGLDMFFLIYFLLDYKGTEVEEQLLSASLVVNKSRV